MPLRPLFIEILLLERAKMRDLLVALEIPKCVLATRT